LLGDDVGEVGVEGPPTLDWLCEDASEADDKAAAMLASIDPEVDRERSPGDGASGRDWECACRARKAVASSASNSSGGRRSFSISDLRLGRDERSTVGKKRETYASSNPEMASLMPSVPNASVPYGNFADPVMLFNSPTFSDSSLLNQVVMSRSTIH
jgi:hypothetical protein